ncbi:MAG TPA: thioredoxin domain-containing protein [Patescibacteria group bacterium]|jgi:protein-disulfide isomerase
MNTESKVLIAIAAVVTVAVGILLVVNGGKDDAAKVADPGKLVRSDSIQTNPKAKVTVVEFADLQCPACAAAQPTVQQVKKQFGDRVNFVWRHFPLSIHQNAQAAAHAAEAANEQGKFFPYTDKLFASQEAWSEVANANAIQLFVSYGTGLGVDGAAIKDAASGQKYKTKIKKDMADGEALQVVSTPTFFVDGKRVDTSQLLQAVSEAVNQQK